MLRTVSLLLGAAVVGGVIGSGVTLLVRGGDSTTKRTAPEIVKALLATECGEPPDGTLPTFLIAPVRANDGDWYTGCRRLFGDQSGSHWLAYCYRVNPDTLEVTGLPDGVEVPACATLPDWPKP